MEDRSSRPHRCPAQTPTRTERRIIKLRCTGVGARPGSVAIFGLPSSTVHKVLRRYKVARLAWLDRATGRVGAPLRARRPGDLVHVDVKKLGRIPDGGGHKMLGRAAGKKNASTPAVGYAYLHNAVDDHSRLAYSEILRGREEGDRRRRSGGGPQAFFAA